MGRFRFSLSNIVGVTAIVGVTSAAITGESEHWAWILELLNMTMLLSSLIFVVYHWKDRPFWLGYFVFSVGTILLRMAHGYNLLRHINLPIWRLQFFSIEPSYNDAPVSSALSMLFAAFGGCIAIVIHSLKDTKDIQ